VIGNSGVTRYRDGRTDFLRVKSFRLHKLANIVTGDVCLAKASSLARLLNQRLPVTDQHCFARGFQCECTSTTQRSEETNRPTLPLGSQPRNTALTSANLRCIARVRPVFFQVRCIAQLQGRSSVVEQRPFKPKVVGSIPTAPTNKSPISTGFSKGLPPFPPLLQNVR